MRCSLLESETDLQVLQASRLPSRAPRAPLISNRTNETKCNYACAGEADWV